MYDVQHIPTWHVYRRTTTSVSVLLDKVQYSYIVPGYIDFSSTYKTVHTYEYVQSFSLYRAYDRALSTELQYL